MFGDFEKFSYLCRCYPLWGNKIRIRHFLEHLKSNGSYKPMGSLQVEGKTLGVDFAQKQ